MNLFDKYVKEIRGWNWANVKAQALQNVEPDEEGELVGRCFLGSIMALTPSGKFYTPFANSNVETCPICHGAGSVHNRKANAERHAKFSEAAKSARSAAMHVYGAFCEGKWPKSVVSDCATLDKLASATAETKTCHRCAGLGSHEAYQDECFNEALEKVAEKNGMYLDYSDGDIFACVTVDQPEEEEESEV